jgi:hypothetical protein
VAVPGTDQTETAARPPRAFYTLGSGPYFLGLVALINSLRLLEHAEPIFVLDCGFTELQRELLSAEATIVPLVEPVFPPLAKAVAPLLHPARQMILIDADMIVLRPLSRLIEQATEGRVVAFADPVSHRHDPRWSTLLGLPELRRQPYVNGGFLIFSDASLPVLEEFNEFCRELDPRNSAFESGSPANPFYYLDQDVFNAVLGTRFRREQVVINEQRLAPHPPFDGLALKERRHTYADGTEPFLLHHARPRKPWLTHSRSTVFSRRFTQLVDAPGLPLTPPIDLVPWRLRRTGARAAVARIYSSLLGRVAENRGRLGIRGHLHKLRVRKERGDNLKTDRSCIGPKGV